MNGIPIGTGGNSSDTGGLHRSLRGGLDLAAAGFVRVAAKRIGRPGFAPADLLKLYIYGYLNRVRSSRRLEAETHRNT